MVFWNKKKIKELNMIDIFFSYFSKVGKTDIKIKIDDKDLNRKIISNVNKEDLSRFYRTVKEVVEDTYNNFYSKSEEDKYGCIAIRIKKV